ncbi:MAG: formimidoylglutamate deiminase [Bacteroidota bacterium]
MKTLRFEGVWYQDKWVSPAFVNLDMSGNVLSIDSEQPFLSKPESVAGYAVPAIPNAHSHAFQYAMAGLAEIHPAGSGQDDFWSWREAMYALALKLNPEQMEAIASMLYAEMLRHGYTHVVEFHYLHHDVNGMAYANLAEMGERLISAAKRAGIRVTLVPILYQLGGFGQAATERQRRFLTADLDSYFRLLARSAKACQQYWFAQLGSGVHSLRAVAPEIVERLYTDLDEKTPFHLHIAEQKKEVTDCLDYLGCRPVEWLLDHVNLTDQVHLVHCTHVTDAEVRGVAQGGAHVVLCPSTEGNLGDGLFPLGKFLQAGGKWSIGTDSHVGLNPYEELRLLDYGQRLTTHTRTSYLARGNSLDSGQAAIEMALEGGAAAAGSDRAGFEIGQAFDAVVFRADAPLIASASKDSLLSRMVYASDVSMQLGTLVAGVWKVKDGRHVAGDHIRQQFISVMQNL